MKWLSVALGVVCLLLAGALVYTILDHDALIERDRAQCQLDLSVQRKTLEGTCEIRLQALKKASGLRLQLARDECNAEKKKEEHSANLAADWGALIDELRVVLDHEP